MAADTTKPVDEERTTRIRFTGITWIRDRRPCGHECPHGARFSHHAIRHITWYMEQWEMVLSNPIVHHDSFWLLWLPRLRCFIWCSYIRVKSKGCIFVRKEKAHYTCTSTLLGSISKEFLTRKFCINDMEPKGYLITGPRRSAAGCWTTFNRISVTEEYLAASITDFCRNCSSHLRVARNTEERQSLQTHRDWTLEVVIVQSQKNFAAAKTINDIASQLVIWQIKVSILMFFPQIAETTGEVACKLVVVKSKETELG